MMSKHNVGVKRGREYLYRRGRVHRKDPASDTGTLTIFPVHHYAQEACTARGLRDHAASDIRRGEDTARYPYSYARCVAPVEGHGSSLGTKSVSPPLYSSSSDADDGYLVGASFSFEDTDEPFFALPAAEPTARAPESNRQHNRWVPDEQYEPEVEIFDFEL
jgi:hypothetical protein